MKRYKYRYQYLWLSYHKDTARSKLRSVPVIIDLTLFLFVAESLEIDAG